MSLKCHTFARLRETCALGLNSTKKIVLVMQPPFVRRRAIIGPVEAHLYTALLTSKSGIKPDF